MDSKILYLFILLTCTATCTGCIRPSVGHLPQKPFASCASEQKITTKNLEFVYQAGIENGKLMVRGIAFPRDEYIPGWAKTFQDLSIYVYLTDSKGRILDKGLKTFLPQKLDRGKGHSFVLTLTPASGQSEEPLYIAFGYSMRLSPKPPYSGRIQDTPFSDDTSDTFSAREGAVYSAPSGPGD
ncbi:MAG: hypothetical protein ACLFSY_08060 [Desulfonatronovibrionaceae bacterium]